MRRGLSKAKHAFSRLSLGAVGHPAKDGPTNSASSQTVWEDNLDDEVGFWNRYLSTSGLEWPEEFQMRLYTSSVVTDDLLASHLSRLGLTDIFILDVGAGPLTITNKTFPGKTLTITATDPLADEYAAFWPALASLLRSEP